MHAFYAYKMAIQLINRNVHDHNFAVTAGENDVAGVAEGASSADAAAEDEDGQEKPDSSSSSKKAKSLFTFSVN